MKKTYIIPDTHIASIQGGQLMQFITTSGNKVDDLGEKDPASRRYRNSLWDDEDEDDWLTE